MNAFIFGFGIGLSLILAIGAQNAFILRQGLQRQHVGLIVAICVLADAVLMGAGVAGFGWMASEAPWVGTLLLYGGVAFLIFYGAMSFRAAWRGDEVLEAEGARVQSWQAAALTCLALTLLNPHVYLDTLVFIGSVSAQYPGQGLAFWAGATTSSAVFFTILGYGARWLAPVFATRRAWQVLDVLVGCTMWTIAVLLLLG